MDYCPNCSQVILPDDETVTKDGYEYHDYCWEDARQLLEDQGVL